MDRCYSSDIERMIRYMENHFREGIGVEDVAKQLRYDPRYCNLLFKTCYGATLGEYLRMLRMEEAKKMLSSGIPVGRVAKALSYKPRGFFYTFRAYFGTSPSQYVKDGKIYGKYLKRYEYHHSEEKWGKGKNPTPDGLWEFAYYDSDTKQYSLMKWDEDRYFFYAPWTVFKTDPYYYCRNRLSGGYGMHPGIKAQAVRTFLCPHTGAVDVVFSMGRWTFLKKGYTPCSVQLYHNDLPITEPVVLDSFTPAQLKASLSVCAGDRIRLHLDAMGDRRGDGIFLFRQEVCYTEISE